MPAACSAAGQFDTSLADAVDRLRAVIREARSAAGAQGRPR
jgi:hypothetical protein